MTRIKTALLAPLIVLAQTGDLWSALQVPTFAEWEANSGFDFNSDGNIDLVDYYLDVPCAWLTQAPEDLNQDGQFDFEDWILWSALQAPTFAEWETSSGFDFNSDGNIDLVDYYLDVPCAWLTQAPEDLNQDGQFDIDDWFLWSTLQAPTFAEWEANSGFDFNSDGNIDLIDYYLAESDAWLAQAPEDLNQDGQFDFEDWILWSALQVPTFAEWEANSGFDFNSDGNIDLVDYYLAEPDAWLTQAPEDLNQDGQFDFEDWFLWSALQAPTFAEWETSSGFDFNSDGNIDLIDYYLDVPCAWLTQAPEDLNQDGQFDIDDWFLWSTLQAPTFAEWEANSGFDFNSDGNIDLIDYYLAESDAWLAQAPEDLNQDGQFDFEDWILWSALQVPTFAEWEANSGFDFNSDGNIDLVDYYLAEPDAWLTQAPEDLNQDGQFDFEDWFLWSALQAPTFAEWETSSGFDFNSDGNIDLIDYYLDVPCAWLTQAPEDLNQDGQFDIDDWFLWSTLQAPTFAEWEANSGFDFNSDGNIDLIDYYLAESDAWLAQAPEDLNQDGQFDFEDWILWSALQVPTFAEWEANSGFDFNSDGNIDLVDYYLAEPDAWLTQAPEDLNQDGQFDFEDWFLWSALQAPTFAEWETSSGFDFNSDGNIDLIDYYLDVPCAWLTQAPEDLNQDGQFDIDDWFLWSALQPGGTPPPIGPAPVPATLDEWALSGTARDWNVDGIIDDFDFYVVSSDAWLAEVAEDTDGNGTLDLNDYFVWTNQNVAGDPPVGDPLPPELTFDQFLVDHLGLNWNGDDALDEIDYYFADYGAWFFGSLAEDINGGGIAYDDWLLWQGEVTTAAPVPPPVPATFAEWAASGLARDLNVDTIVDFDDYIRVSFDAWFAEIGVDEDGSGTIDFDDHFIWFQANPPGLPPVGDPPPPSLTVDQFRSDPLSLDWTGDGMVDDIDYYFVDYSAWFAGPLAEDIDGGGIVYFDWVLWHDVVGVPVPMFPPIGPPPDVSEPFFGDGFVEDVTLDADGGGTLIMRQLHPIELPPGTEFLDEQGVPLDRALLQQGDLLDVRACWTQDGHGVAQEVLSHVPRDPGIIFEIPRVFPEALLPFGAIETTNGVDFLRPHIPDIHVDPTAVVRDVSNIEDPGVTFAEAVNTGRFSGGTQIHMTGRSDGGVTTIENIVTIDSGFFVADRFETIHSIDEQTCTMTFRDPNRLIDAATVFVGLDPADLPEDTPLVVQYDFQTQIVLQVEPFDETADYDPLLLAAGDSGVGVFFANFVSIDQSLFGQQTLRTYQRQHASFAADVTVLDENVQDVTGIDLQLLLGQFVQVHKLADPSLVPTLLVTEISLTAPLDQQPVTQRREGRVGAIEPGLSGDLIFSFARHEVAFNSETRDELGNTFDPSTLSSDIVKLLVYWTAAGEATATKVLTDGDIPIGVPSLQFLLGGTEQLADGREVIVSQGLTFAVASDATVTIGPDIFTFVHAIDSGQLHADLQVQIVYDETPGGLLQEVIVLDQAPGTDTFEDVTATIHDIDFESYSASIQFEPFPFDPAVPFLDAGGINAVGVFDLVESPIIIQVDPQAGLATRVQEFSPFVDNSHLFQDQSVETLLAILTGVDGNLLLSRNLARISIAVDSRIIDDQSGDDVTDQLEGLAGLVVGEPMRLRKRVGQPGELIPRDLIVEVGINPVLAGQPPLPPPDQPMGPGPNVSAFVTGDLNPDPLDQELTNFELGPGDVGQIAIYGYQLSDLAGIGVRLRYDESQLNFDGATASLHPNDPNILDPLEEFAEQAAFLPPAVEDGLVIFAGSLVSGGQIAPRPDGLLMIAQVSPTADFSGSAVIIEQVSFNAISGVNDIINPGRSLFFVPPLAARADIDGDGCVLWQDLFEFADQWGKSEFESKFDFNLDGAVDEFDFFILARAFGTCGLGKQLADVASNPRDGTLRLETIIDRDGLSLLVFADGVEAAGGAVFVEYDPRLVKLNADDGGWHGESALLYTEEPGRVLVVSEDAGAAGSELLARLQFERLLPEVDEGTFRVREAVVRRADGVLVQPDMPEAVTVDWLPESFALAPNYPNPFNSSTTISFQLPLVGVTRLEIFDLLGQNIRSLVDGELAAGFHHSTWDGRDDDGLLTAAGPYLYRLRVSPADQNADLRQEYSEVRRLLFLK